MPSSPSVGRVEPADARARFAAARVARLATVTPAGNARLVPVVFALDGDVLTSAVDAKPKRTRQLRRLTDIAAHPRVCVLVDHYDEDWDALWWVRADGQARVVEVSSPEGASGLVALRGKYPQYRGRPPAGPVVRVVVDSWRGWSAR